VQRAIRPPANPGADRRSDQHLEGGFLRTVGSDHIEPIDQLGVAAMRPDEARQNMLTLAGHLLHFTRRTVSLLSRSPLPIEVRDWPKMDMRYCAANVCF